MIGYYSLNMTDYNKNCILICSKPPIIDGIATYQ